MTGYALVSAEHPNGALTIELRSVNSRYLDLQFRVPDELRALEPMLREAISARIARGKVDCRLALGARTAGAASLDPDTLESLRALERAARHRITSYNVCYTKLLRPHGVPLGSRRHALPSLARGQERGSCPG